MKATITMGLMFFCGIISNAQNDPAPALPDGVPELSAPGATPARPDKAVPPGEQVQPGSGVYAVDTVAPRENPLLNVFIDCKRCDEDFLKKEVTFVGYVRDRYEAQVHILITTQNTASGGMEYSLEFIGRKDFSGINDTLKLSVGPLDTEDINRNKLAKAIKTGLIRYVAKSSVMENISISYSGKENIEPVKDLWNSWVFTVSLDGSFNGDKAVKSQSLSNSLSANRITEDWKIKLNTYVDYNEDKFQTSDGTLTSLARSYNFSGRVIKSVNNHWSAGIGGNLESGTFNNIRLKSGIGPEVEYNIFPYFQSVNKRLCLQYGIDYYSVKYAGETIYNRTSENLLQESLGIILDVNEKWGTIGGAVSGSHYFHDFSKYNLNFVAGLSLKIVKGFSFNLFGQFSKVHDQLSLQKSGASDEEILLKRSQIATQYRYNTFMGVSYTFGSIHSSTVNPRFNGLNISF